MPDPLPADIGAAIDVRLNGNQGIVAGFSGGVYRDRTAGPPNGPYLVFKVLSARTAWTSDVAETFDTRLRFTCYAATAALAASLRGLVEAEFNASQLICSSGWT